MNQYEKLVPEELRFMIETMAGTARGHIERDGKLSPMAFIGKFDGQAVLLGGLGNIGKDKAAAAMRKTAKEIDADFVLHIDEAWTTSTRDPKEVERLREQYKEVRLMPGRVDVVMF